MTPRNSTVFPMWTVVNPHICGGVAQLRTIYMIEYTSECVKQNKENMRAIAEIYEMNNTHSVSNGVVSHIRDELLVPERLQSACI